MVSVRQKYRGGRARGEGDEAGESNQNGKRMIGAGGMEEERKTQCSQGRGTKVGGGVVVVV